MKLLELELTFLHKLSLGKKKQNPKKQNQKTALKPRIFTGPNMISYPILASPWPQLAI